ncbi:VOC family protein [Aliishimia ponticola]|uniref:VOC family protein n=1 Tax=Aliishimia ponticola TaxID=2499833 RepID=A0A4V3XK60_9RHOB|nr:VOC family protein [Aliishimia ponticola]THH35703.1 VOC family protein [Aliishimia ponticola]
MAYKPEGYTDISPYLLVADIAATLDFLEAAFGATRLRLHHRPNGDPMHAEARIGDSVVMLGQAPGGDGAHVHIYVPDVRATYAAALKAGATSVQEPLDQGDGDLRAGVQDSQGTIWWPSTQLSVR